MALQGFVESEYLAAKLAALQADSATAADWAGKTTTDLKTFLDKVGFTPESHYQAYGWAEGLAPNALFNAAEYKLAKATDMYNDGLNVAGSTPYYETVAEAQAAFEAAWPYDPYLHYLEYGSTEGINPSNAFDESEYLAAKLADLKADPDPDIATEWADKTVDDVRAAFTAAGLSALGHYQAYGKGEGIAVTEVPADEKVADEKVADDGGEEVPGETFTLTASTDRLEGTENDDTFEAHLSQNQLVGGVSNTLSSADVLDGGAGTDSLHAEIVPEFFGVNGGDTIDVQPRTTSIEDVTFEARDLGTGGDVTVDAKYMADVVNIGSKQSDGDLTIENLTTLTSAGAIRNTDTITITMDHTDNVNHDGDASDLTVYFDEDYLVADQSVQSQAIYYLLDQDADMNNTDVDGDGVVDLLAKINTNGLRFTVDGGAEQVLEFDDGLLSTGDILNHDDFVAALQPALDALIAAGTVPADTTLTVDTTMTRTTFLDDGSVSSPIPAIVLESQSTTGIESVGFLWVEDLSGEFNVYGRVADAEGTEDNPVAINVELDKVGRDNDGGDLEIGGKHSEGIPDFYVEVLGDEDRPSNLGTITTNPDVPLVEAGLNNVYISTHADYVDGETFASLTIRNGFANQSSVDLVDADDFLGDLTLGSVTPVNDLIVLEARGGGDVSFTGLVDGATVGVDDVLANDGRAYSYSTGSGDDTFAVTLDGDAVDADGVGPESFAISTGSGDDVVGITSVAGVSQQTMFILDNLSINTGSGADRVTINGYERFDIDTESGDDYVEITSVNPADGSTGVWNFGATTGVQPFVDRVLYHAELTVNFAGFENTVAVETDAAGNYIADQLTINAAIMAAIDGSTVLSELLDYNPGTSDQYLQITSDFDGANELSIDLFQPTMVAADAVAGEIVLSAGDVTAIRQGIINTTILDSSDLEDAAEIIAEFNDGTTANLGDGSLSQTGNDISTDQFDYQFQLANADATADATIEENYSTINTSTGDDIVVLHSNDVSANTLVFDSEFNHLTVVNFFDDAARTVTGNHIFDFTAYLNNQQDPSDAPDGNTQSTVAIPITYDGAETAAAGDDLVGNEFTVLKPDFDTDDAFAGLSASNFLAAINGDDATTNYADIDDNSLDAADSPFGDNFVGDVQDHMVFVENDANRGEYKVFYLTSDMDADGDVDNADGDFASASLLGTIDFGATITGDPISEANLWNSADPTGDGTTSWGSYYLNDVITGDDVVIPGDDDDDDDDIAPTLESSTPADEATDVAVDSDIVLTFDEDVEAGAGNIMVYNAADDSVVEAVDVADAVIAGDIVTIDLAADLAAGTDYYVEIEAGAIVDLAGNAYAGITDPIYNFTTAEGAAGIPVTEDLTAVDGVAETFIYQIDSSTGDVISLAGGDWTITDFNVAEDSLVFDDVAAGTVTTETFVDAITVSESGIFSETNIYFAEDTEGTSYELTLAGVVDGDLSTVDFTVA